MKAELISVVIPTFNRSEVLRRAVEGYLSQAKPELIRELLVIDDGSSDDTQATVLSLSARAPFEIRYFKQTNRGPATARNLGIKEAVSEIILFSDDDIIPSTNLVHQHAEWHDRFRDSRTAVLGQVTWDSELRPTPFMRWYGADGPLFAYDHFSGLTELEDYRYFYTCNLSARAPFLRENGMFNESFTIAAYEDTEFGYRLKRAGMRLLYNQHALAYHRQRITFDEACRRLSRGAGAYEIFRQTEAGADYFATMHKARTQSLAKAWLRRALASIAPILSPLGVLFDSRFPLPWPVYRLVFQAFHDHSQLER